jgi:hypothetical protein
MKTCLISNEGRHDPPWHRMVVDGFGLLVDLSHVRISAVDPSSLTDPSIKRVEWGPVQLANGETVERGVIVRQDDQAQTFFEKSLLDNYLHLFERQKAKVVSEHGVSLAAQDAENQAALNEAARIRLEYLAREQDQRRVEASDHALTVAANIQHAALTAEHAETKKALEAKVAEIRADEQKALQAQRTFLADQERLRAEQAAIAEARRTNTVDAFTGGWDMRRWFCPARCSS